MKVFILYQNDIELNRIKTYLSKTNFQKIDIFNNIVYFKSHIYNNNYINNNYINNNYINNNYINNINHNYLFIKIN